MKFDLSLPEELIQFAVEEAQRREMSFSDLLADLLHRERVRRLEPEAHYSEMAQDTAREVEAEDWVETLSACPALDN